MTVKNRDENINHINNWRSKIFVGSKNNNKTFNNRKDNIIVDNKTFVQIDTQPALPAQPEYEYEEDVLPAKLHQVLVLPR